MNTYRILLVDDDQDMHLIYKSSLQPLSVTFDDAYDGGEALGLLKKNAYDLILLDLVMPDVNGFEFLDKVQEQKLSLPFVIVCSSMREKEIVMAAFQLGASDFLFKPVQVSQVRSTVQTYLDTLARSQSDFSNLKSLVESEIGYVASRSIGASSPASAAGSSASKGSLHFDSISKAISYMVFNRETGKLVVTSSRGTGELHYSVGRLQKVTFDTKVGIDALEALKLLLHVDVVLVK
ncbi:MAG: response regulator [Chloroherpetonaceae bacterium]